MKECTASSQREFIEKDILIYKFLILVLDPDLVFQALLGCAFSETRPGTWVGSPSGVCVNTFSAAVNKVRIRNSAIEWRRVSGIALYRSELLAELLPMKHLVRERSGEVRTLRGPSRNES